jgi:hypothetical protein
MTLPLHIHRGIRGADDQTIEESDLAANTNHIANDHLGAGRSVERDPTVIDEAHRRRRAGDGVTESLRVRVCGEECDE